MMDELDECSSLSLCDLPIKCAVCRIVVFICLKFQNVKYHMAQRNLLFIYIFNHTNEENHLLFSIPVLFVVSNASSWNHFIVLLFYYNFICYYKVGVEQI